MPFPLLHKDGGSLAKYGELVEARADGIGVALDASGTADNTIIVFGSDGGGKRWSNNWPFVGEKGDLAEGGIRCTVHRPLAGGPRRWARVEHASITMDWTATLLDAAGVEPDADFPPDGVSLLPWLLDGADCPKHDLMWRISSQGAVRRGRFKYLRYLRDRAILGNWPCRHGTYELLYDVSVDGREAADIARHHPDVVAELREVWDRYDAELIPYADGHPGRPRHAASVDRRSVKPTEKQATACSIGWVGLASLLHSYDRTHHAVERSAAARGCRGTRRGRVEQGLDRTTHAPPRERRHRGRIRGRADGHRHQGGEWANREGAQGRFDVEGDA